MSAHQLSLSRQNPTLFSSLEGTCFMSLTDYHCCTTPHLFWIYYTFLSWDDQTCKHSLRRDHITKVKFLFLSSIPFLVLQLSFLFQLNIEYSIRFKDLKNWQKEPPKRDSMNIVFLFLFSSNIAQQALNILSSFVMGQEIICQCSLQYTLPCGMQDLHLHCRNVQQDGNNGKWGRTKIFTDSTR